MGSPCDVLCKVPTRSIYTATESSKVNYCFFLYQSELIRRDCEWFGPPSLLSRVISNFQFRLNGIYVVLLLHGVCESCKETNQEKWIRKYWQSVKNRSVAYFSSKIKLIHQAVGKGIMHSATCRRKTPFRGRGPSFCLLIIPLFVSLEIALQTL